MGMHYDCDESQKQRAMVLMEKCCIETEREFFDCALTLFEWAVEQKESGRPVGTMDNGSFKNVVIPALECLTQKKEPG